VAVDGAVLAEARLPFTVPARSVATLAVPPRLRPAAGSDRELLTFEADGLRALWFAVRDKDFDYPAPRWDITVTADGDTAEVTVTARTLLRDLLLQADRLDPAAAADRGLTTLLPGESVTISVRGWPRPTAEAAAAALYCVNSAVRDTAPGHRDEAAETVQ
jgi:beta-mannosidase